MGNSELGARHDATGRHGFPWDVRAPVTGTEVSDVAGSLTYLFNAQGVADDLICRDDRTEPTGMYLQQVFGMQRYATLGPGLFLAFAGAQPVSVMYVENATVHSEDQPRTRGSIEIELNAPRPGAVLSQPWLDRLQHLRDAKAL